MTQTLTPFLLRVCRSVDALRRLVLLLVLAALAPALRAASVAAKRPYDVAAGDATVTLRQFADQSGEQVVYVVTRVRGVKTNPVKGEFTAREVIERMVANTGLVVIQDAQTGALSINRPPSAPESHSGSSEGTPPLRKRRTLAAAVAGWLAVTLAPAPYAQTVPAVPPDSASATVQLSPFVVNTSKDVGYQANSTLSGSRTNTELRDIANPVDIFTKELMDDLGIRDIQDLTLFATGVEPNAAGDDNTDGQEREIWNYNYMQIRGFKVGTATRNFMELQSTFDAYNSERVEFSKGPNSILFGTGNPGGSSNYSTKVPAFHQNFRSLQWGIDDVGTSRVSGDVNHILVRDKLAVRLNLLHQEREFYRVPSYHDERAAHLVATFRPFKETTITVGHEYRDSKRASPRGVYANDAVTGYLEAGAPRVTGVPATGNNVQINGQAGTVSAASQNLRIYGNNWVLDSAGVIRNTARTATGANYSVNGSGIPSINATALGYPHNQVVGGDNGIADTRWEITEAEITHRIGEKFNVSLAFGRSDSDKRQTNSVDNILKIDPNHFGGNPFAGRYFIETQPFRIDIENRIVDYRGTASYEFDLRKIHRWLGTHQLAGMAERNERREVWDHGRLVLVSGPDGPFNWGATGFQNASARFFIRDYLDFANGVYSGRDLRGLLYSDGIQQNGYRAEFRRPTAFAAKKDLTEQDSLLGVLHSRWWDGRFVSTVGLRRDRREFRTAAFMNDAVTGERRPVDVIAGAPAGSFDPRNARLPDRPELLEGISRNFGGVLHATNWLSLNFSYATNFSPVTESLNLFGQRVPPSSGESIDYGFRLNLLQGRLSLSLLRYETSELGTIINGGSVNVPNSLIDGVEDILLEHGITSASPVTGGSWTTSDSVAKGEELVVVGRPMSGFDVRLSATRNDRRLTNLAPEVKAFFAEREALYVQHAGLRALSGAGDTIGERLELIRTQFSFLRTRENVQRFPASKYTARLTTKYTFDRSGWRPLRGVSIGGNVRWASAPVIGYYRNANNTFDVNRAYRGEDERNLDLFFIYQRRLSQRLDWRIQLNLDNVFDETDPIPVGAINTADASAYNWFITRWRPRDGLMVRLTNTLNF